MKITNVRALVLSYTYKNGIADALNYFSKRNAVIVILETDNGNQGIGESACFGGPPTSTKYLIENEFENMLLEKIPLMLRVFGKKCGMVPGIMVVEA